MSGGRPAGPALPGRRAIVLAYDGTDFEGWQVQPGRRTVQGVVEAALEGLLGAPVRVAGAGRTDAGVHACAQVCSFDDPRPWPPARLHSALAAALPPDVRPLAVRDVPPDFHALHSARRKTYVYQLHLSSAAGGMRSVEHSLPPLRRRTFHAVRRDIDVGAMRAAARALRGRHDFTALSKAMPAGRSTLKTLEALRVLHIPEGLRIVASADGFLYGMVRMLAGLLVEVGRGRRSATDVPALLAAADRARSPPSLPAHALHLWRIDYGDVLPCSALRGRLLS